MANGLSKVVCANCGDKDRPRGRLSPYFCEPCDERRVAGINAFFKNTLAGNAESEEPAAASQRSTEGGER